MGPYRGIISKLIDSSVGLDGRTLLSLETLCALASPSQPGSDLDGVQADQIRSWVRSVVTALTARGAFKKPANAFRVDGAVYVGIEVANEVLDIINCTGTAPDPAALAALRKVIRSAQLSEPEPEPEPDQPIVLQIGTYPSTAEPISYIRHGSARLLQAPELATALGFSSASEMRDHLAEITGEQHGARIAATYPGGSSRTTLWFSQSDTEAAVYLLSEDAARMGEITQALKSADLWAGFDPRSCVREQKPTESAGDEPPPAPVPPKPDASSAGSTRVLGYLDESNLAISVEEEGQTWLTAAPVMRYVGVHDSNTGRALEGILRDSGSPLLLSQIARKLAPRNASRSFAWHLNRDGVRALIRSAEGRGHPLDPRGLELLNSVWSDNDTSAVPAPAHVVPPRVVPPLADPLFARAQVLVAKNLSQLSVEETRAVLEGCAEGRTVRDIASVLGIGPEGVQRVVDANNCSALPPELAARMFSTPVAPARAEEPAAGPAAAPPAAPPHVGRPAEAQIGAPIRLVPPAGEFTAAPMGVARPGRRTVPTPAPAGGPSTPPAGSAVRVPPANTPPPGAVHIPLAAPEKLESEPSATVAQLTEVAQVVEVLVNLVSSLASVVVKNQLLRDADLARAVKASWHPFGGVDAQAQKEAFRSAGIENGRAG